jgi:membrane protein DedA with SNARE-associated domain
MMIESACIPLPSEIIMPFSGFLVSSGKMGFWPAVIAGSFGNLAGSVLVYLIAVSRGREFFVRFGRYFFISRHDIQRADDFFSKYGDWTVFVSRILPIIRTFISLPAGVSKMNFVKFIIFSFIGSVPWCIMLTYIGLILGERWQLIESYFRQFDVLIGITIIAALVYWIKKHFNRAAIVQ